jgi:nitrate reductase (cytochrome)
MSPVERRTFLKGMAAASAAVAGGALVPGVLAALEPGEGTAARGPDWHRAPCNLCGVGCGLLVGVQNGRAVAVKGDPDSPVSNGLACVRGYHSVQTLYARDRLTRALVRSRGRLVEAPVSEALDIVAGRLRDVLAAHGSDSVGVYGSGQWTIADAYVAVKLFKGALGTSHVDTDVRLHSGSALAGLATSFGQAAPVGCYEDVDRADVFVIWDTNLAETDPVLFSRMLRRRRSDPGVRIVELATRTTRTSYAADRSLIYAPHADLALANAIAHELVTRRWVNRDFVDRHVAFRTGATRIGYPGSDQPLLEEVPRAASLADYQRFLGGYSPARAQQLSGVAAADIRWLASLYGDRSRGVVSVWGSSLNAHGRGTWLNNLIHNIHLLVGKVATPGNGTLCLSGQPGGFGMIHDAGAHPRGLPAGTVTSESDRRKAADIWGLPEARLARRPGHHALGLFRAFDRGDLRFLWVQASNPMSALPNLDRYRRGEPGGRGFLVVSDVYPTATSDVADVVLPAALWIEREGVYGNGERRVQHFGRLVAPPGEAASDAWLMTEVARRLGFGDLFPWAENELVEGVWAEYSRFHEHASRRPPAIARLRQEAGVLWPAHGRQETRWRYNTAHDPAADRGRGGWDFYGHEDHRAWIWLRPYEPPAEAPDAEYPFWLSTGDVLEHRDTGTLTRRVPTLHRAVPRAYAELNADDARRLGIRQGERVRLVTRRGSLEIEARIDYRAQPQRGLVFVPSFDELLPVHQLTLDAGCPLSGQPDVRKCAVRVERLQGERG